MPIIRQEIQDYVRLWNVHKIRRQSNRPNCVTGQPMMLYNYPDSGVENFGLSVDEDLLEQLQNDVGSWGKTLLLHLLIHFTD
jgi:hypothetical protein